MSLERELEGLKRKINRITPKVNPPELKMNIFSEDEWNNKKPTKQSPWELNLVIEDKKDYFTKQGE